MRATIPALPCLALLLSASCGGKQYSGKAAPDRTMAAPAPSATARQAVRTPADAERPPMDRERYDRIYENDFTSVDDQPLSTFSIDVDTASYSNVRRFLRRGDKPPAGAVRIEELVNYFQYDYPDPEGEHPFSVNTEVSRAPWSQDHMLLHVGLQGERMERDEVPPRNLVFLLDVSGSMNSPKKLGLLKQAFSLLVEQLDERDHVSIAVYAGASGMVLEPTPGSDNQKILGALGRLRAGGSTNGGAGIQLAYKLAEQNFDPEAINRVILATDGDFNVGTTDESSLTRLIEEKRESGVFLTVLGFGMGNLNDSTMEKLADKGNGNYAYIDTLNEARKVLVTEIGSTLVTIAKDVKIQIEFNPKQVAEYRLIGYENRLLDAEDFNDDTKDAGEIGAGHSVTALYELVPAGAPAESGDKVDPLKYQEDRELSEAAGSGELATAKLRYKAPDGDESQLLTRPIAQDVRELSDTSDDFRFSAAVAGFGMLLRGSKHAGEANFAMVDELARDAAGDDPHGYRAGFLELVSAAHGLYGDEGREAEIAE